MLSLRKCLQSIFGLTLLFMLMTAASASIVRAATFTVTKTADTNDGVCDADCSLREAIAAANQAASDDAIAFDTTAFGTVQTITLGGTQLQINNNGRLAINGSGSNLLTINGGQTSNVFRIEPNATVIITGVTITNGKLTGFGSGAGIINQLGTLTVANSVITGNVAGENGEGGGIYNCGGDVTVNNTTVSNNSAGSNGGGGIATGDSCVSGRTNSLTIYDSNFSNNTTTNNGGGIKSSSVLNITNTVISGNSANFGGGIITGSTTNLTNVTIRNNTAVQNSGGISGGSGTLVINSSNISQNKANNYGGAMSFAENSSVTINNSIIDSNNAVNRGGGIYNFRATVSLNNSVVSGNIAAQGGGAYNDSLSNTLTFNNSTVASNTANSGDGGGINNAGGTLSVINSTVSGNNATAAAGEGGGGIYNVAATNVTNSTITGNTTAKQGGGIFNRGTINLNSSTINNNQSAGGGGIYNFDFRTVNARNIIIADNILNGGGVAPDFRGAITSQGYNLIENTSGATVGGTTIGNIIGRDPELAPLRNNGGATQTVALLPTSPAIDAGDPNNFPATDQRGVSRPQDGDINGTALPDIGAYERRVTVFTTTKTTDSDDGICDADCSLREAIAATNAATTPDNAVVFNPTILGQAQTILLTGGDLRFSNPNGTFLINGTRNDLLTISGNNASRVISVTGGANATLSNLTVTGGNSTSSLNNGRGGGIYVVGSTLTINNSIVRGNKTLEDGLGGGIYSISGGTLNINNSVVSDNKAEGAFGSGGGIYSSTAALNLDKSTVSGNVAGRSGGGVFNVSGTANIKNSTVSANTAKLNGGGINNNVSGTLYLTNSTISGNSIVSDIADPNSGGGISNNGTAAYLVNVTVSRNSAGNGGGVVTIGETLYSRNSIFADNTTTIGSSPDFFGSLVSQGYNLIKNTSGATVTGITAGNLLNVDPLLDPVLRNNGGATLTHALRLNSPAIDAGSAAAGITTDQRGFARPFDFPSIPNAAGGNGSDIGAFERQTTDANPKTLFDFDGDGKADVSVYRPSEGNWYISNSGSGGALSVVRFGLANDKIVPADYDGDGKTDVAIFRPSEGNWYLLRSRDGFGGVHFGNPEDIPQPADFDGDGKSELAVYRPSAGIWYVFNLVNNNFTGVQFGNSTDKPVAADYDGDGRTDYAVYRPSEGNWYLQQSTAGFSVVRFGLANDKPVPADYDGDGKADEAIYRPDEGNWYLQRSRDGFGGAHFGAASDVPAPADFDGDGKTDLAVFRPSEGAWYQLNTKNGFQVFGFGVSTDKPVPNAFVP